MGTSLEEQQMIRDRYRSGKDMVNILFQDVEHDSLAMLEERIATQFEDSAGTVQQPFFQGMRHRIAEIRFLDSHLRNEATGANHE